MRFINVKVAVVLAALILVVVVTAGGPGNQDDYKQSNGHVCGMEGNAKSAAAKALDRQKNRHMAPTDEDMDDEVTLAAMLMPGDDEQRFDASKGAEISGLVVNVKKGGMETCNCKAKALVDRDTHIELALHKDAPETQRVIVEITPRLRAQMKEKGVDWATPTLKKQIEGKWIKVTGWLLFDSMHFGEAENTNPGGSHNWRATCWEIHPITSLEVLDGPPRGTVEIHPDALRSFHRARAVEVKHSKEKRDALEERRKKIVADFDEEDLDEEPR